MSAAVEVLRSPEARHEQFSSVLTHAPVALALCDGQGIVNASNPAFEQLLGIQSGQIHRPLAALMQPRDGTEIQVMISDICCGTRDAFQLECPATPAEIRPLRWTVWGVQGANGDSDCALVMVEDLSDITSAMQRLQQTERLETVGRLAGGVAHDFNNLLTGVLLYCDLLMTAIEPGHRARKYAEEIRNAGLQASGLVRQLLSVVRSNKAVPRPLSLNEIAEGMRNLLVRLIGEDIELDLRLDPTLGLVKMDPVQAQQILLNLVLNARDALPRGGRIVLESGNCKIQFLSSRGASASDTACLPCALFAVEDNGTGMDDSVRAHLFEPFFTTKAGKGTGIGLATVHDIVSSNGGLIHVQTELHRGTRISLLLPIIPDSVPGAIEDSSFHTTQDGEVLSFHPEEFKP
jgi:two-component system cell cycle sensor histidine kinase/response regulator CckA